MSEKHGNPMVRCPEALHPLVKEFARLYRSGNQQRVLEALQQALTKLSTGDIAPVSSQDISNVLVDILDRLNRIEKAVLTKMPTSDDINVYALPPGMEPLLQVGLASRLGVSESTLWRARQSNDFADWCRSRDPDGIAWEYRPAKKGEPQYFPSATSRRKYLGG